MSVHYTHFRLREYRNGTDLVYAADELSAFVARRDFLVWLARSLGQPYPHTQATRDRVNALTVCTVGDRVGIAFCTEKNFCRSTGRELARNRANGHKEEK